MEDSEARAVFRYVYLISYEAPGIIEFLRNANCYSDLCVFVCARVGNYTLYIA